MQRKMEKVFCDLEIIAFGLVALTTGFYSKKILVSGVSILTNSLKVSDNTKGEFFELIFFQIDQKI